MLHSLSKYKEVSEWVHECIQRPKLLRPRTSNSLISTLLFHIRKFHLFFQVFVPLQSKTFITSGPPFVVPQRLLKLHMTGSVVFLNTFEVMTLHKLEIFHKCMYIRWISAAVPAGCSAVPTSSGVMYCFSSGFVLLSTFGPPYILDFEKQVAAIYWEDIGYPGRNLWGTGRFCDIRLKNYQPLKFTVNSTH